MKTLIILALAAVEAAANMQKSVAKAQDAQEAANKAIKETTARVEEAVQDSRD